MRHKSPERLFGRSTDLLWIGLLLCVLLTASCTRRAALNKLQNMPPCSAEGINGLVIAPAGTPATDMPEEWQELGLPWIEAALPLPANLCLIPSTRQDASGLPLAMCVLDAPHKAGKVITARPIAGLVFRFEGQPMRVIIGTSQEGIRLPPNWIDMQVQRPAFFDFWESWLLTAFPPGTVSQIEWRPETWCIEVTDKYKLR